jgi:hypothetical protein
MYYYHEDAIPMGSEEKAVQIDCPFKDTPRGGAAAMGVVVWPMIELGADDALWPRISRRRKGKRVTAYFVTNC